MPFKSIIALMIGNLFISSAFSTTQAKFLAVPTTTPTLQVPAYTTYSLSYNITNQTKTPKTLTLVPMQGVTQELSSGVCSSRFTLAPKESCVLSLLVNANRFGDNQHSGPQVCATQSPTDATPNPFMCSQPSAANLIQTTSLDSAFPYGSAPKGDVCVTSDYYATPETMLGSWAMIDAVAMDSAGHVLPSFLTPENVVYAVGTAAIGNELGLANCSTGCNDLNGYCFALQFNDKSTYPYMIFQSVNIGANPSSFDIYLAGGGSGAFPESCAQFWGTDNSVNWAAHIEDSSCEAYFNNYATIHSQYAATYASTTHPAKQTLIDACQFASSSKTGFNTQNFQHVTVVPVTCPASLTQITGVAIPNDITVIGNQTIQPLSTLTINSFTQSSIKNLTTTQMQDCKTPSSGYCGNVPSSVTNYEASISANLMQPLLTGAAPSNNFCQGNPSFSGGFCTWDKGKSQAGGSYCNASSSNCLSCGNYPEWCVCNSGNLVGCSA